MDEVKSKLAFFEPHYSTVIFRGYLKVLLEHHSSAGLDALFRDRIGVGMDYLLDQNNWLSETASEHFYECVELLEPGNIDLHYLAGRRSLSSKDLGFFTHFISTFISFETLLSSTLKAQNKINKVDELTVLDQSRTGLRVRIKSSRETQYLDRIAHNWRGFLTEFPRIFGLTEAKVTIHPLDSKTFEIETKWRHNTRIQSGSSRKRIRWTAAAGLISLRLCFLKGALLWGFPLLIGAVVFILLEFQSIQRKNREHQNLDLLISSAEARYSELYQSKKEVEDLFSQSRVISSVATKVVEARTAEEVISLATSRLHDELGYGRALFFMRNPETEYLELLAGEGLPDALKSKTASLRFDLNDDTGNPDHIVHIFKTRTARRVSVTESYLSSLSLETRSFIKASGIDEFFALSVATPETTLGVLFVTASGAQKPTEGKNIETLKTIANHLAMSIEKSSRLEEETRLRTLFESYVSTEVIKNSGVGKGKNFVRRGSAAILFCDLRGFTQMMNQPSLNPETTLSFIQKFYELVTDEVYGQGGFVNKFLGDGALGVFEIKVGEDPSLVIEKAISAALKIQERAVQVLGSTLRVSAGLHLGEVAFATVGKAPKLEFTVLGDAVNVSSRLCNLSKEHDNVLVISESLKNTSPPSLFAEVLGEFKIKGIEEKMNLFGIPLKPQTKQIA